MVLGVSVLFCMCFAMCFDVGWAVHRLVLDMMMKTTDFVGFCCFCLVLYMFCYMF